MKCNVYSAILAGALLAGLAGCAAQPTPAQPVPTVGLANPASVYCEQKGGVLISKQSEQGSYALCRLPDGTEIEEWALFRRDHPRPPA